MTTFEIIITVLVALVVLLVGFIAYRLDILMHNAIAFFIRTGKQITDTRADMYDDVGNHYLVEILNKLDNIESKNDQGFKELTDIVDKMHRNLCVEIADKMVDRAYPPSCVTPCNPPDNIRKWDCVNCPKRSACGTLSPTNTIKVKGKRCELTDEELMKRINEDNKED